MKSHFEQYLVNKKLAIIDLSAILGWPVMVFSHTITWQATCRISA